tara:strand:- start:1599 stop:2069 length:471 start_codon:yes stop_codon:yes gene_type:complete
MSNQSNHEGTGRQGNRGIPQKDKVRNTHIYVGEYTDENGKRERVGHTRIERETNEQLLKLAKIYKKSRTTLIREALESLCKYAKDAKEIGGQPFFSAQQLYDGWLQTRNDVHVLLQDIEKNNATIQETATSKEVKMIAHQVASLARMINIMHRNII